MDGALDRSMSVAAMGLMVLLASGSGGLGLPLLVHAFHLSTLLLHLLAACLAVVLSSLVLAVVHALMLGMGIGNRRGLCERRNGKGKRNCANDALHLKISENLKFETVIELQPFLGGGVAISGSVPSNRAAICPVRGAEGFTPAAGAGASAAGSAVHIAVQSIFEAGAWF
jgi:hypothetical protein